MGYRDLVRATSAKGLSGLEPWTSDEEVEQEQGMAA